MAKSVTQAQRKQLEKLYTRMSAAQAAVFACAPNDRTPFRQCFDMAPVSVQQEFKSAQSARSDFERSLTAQGRGWFNSFGHFYSY